MSEKNPCFFCGDDSEYLRFLGSCAKRANEICHENEVKIFANMYKSMDFVQVVRCRDCKYMHTVKHWLGMDVDECWLHADRESGALGKERTDPDGFCAWGERRD